MPDSKYFGIPFGTSGDRATIPEATQPGGAVSYQQGFGPDYERDPDNDPLAKRVPRDETNEFYFQLSNALKFLQLYGTPEWYAADDSGNALSYPLSARVRRLVDGQMRVYRSLVATNTAQPGTDAAKWALDEAFSFSESEASLAEALAGTLGTKIITPRRLASAAQRGAWNYAVAAGTVDALTASLSPAPGTLAAGLPVRLILAGANTATAPTLNLNGLGAKTIVRHDGTALVPGDLKGVADLIYDGTNWRQAALPAAGAGRLIGVQRFTASGTYTPTPGMTFSIAEGVGGGGAGGGATAPNSGLVSLGAPGTAGTWGKARFTAAEIGASRAVTIGAGGTPTPGGAGGSGGDTLFGNLLQLPGGRGGGTLNAQTPPTVNGNGLVSAAATGANIASRSGTAPTASFGFSGSQGFGAPGGDSPLGAGGYGVSANVNGVAANGNGAGGGGCALIVGGGTGSGGAGSPGLLIILDYGA